MISYDLRGHGRSKGHRGHIDQFETYLNDLEDIVNLFKRDRVNSAPMFMYGHSMGGLITYLYLKKYAQKHSIASAVLSSPAINIHFTPIQSLKVNLAKFLRKLSPTLNAGEKGQVDLLTNDKEMRAKYLNDRYILGDITISLVLEAIKASAEALTAIEQQNGPKVRFLFIQGTEDTIVDADQNLMSAKKFVEPKNIYAVKGALHEPLNAARIERNALMKRSLEFLNTRSC